MILMGRQRTQAYALCQSAFLYIYFRVKEMTEARMLVINCLGVVSKPFIFQALQLQR